MNYIITTRAFRCGLLALTLLATGCKKELDDYYAEQGPQYPTLLTTNALGTATKYTTGETVTFELQFAQQTDPIKQIVILEKVEPARDSAVAQTIAYRAAYSRIKRTDTLLVNYVVPAGANKALVRVDARVDSQNGQTKTRSFYFRLAEATPTIVVNSGPTNVTLPTATPAPGDIIRYRVTLNRGGIGAAPVPPATTAVPAGTLYKDLDSLVTYARIGTAPERRIVRTKLTATGAATSKDLVISSTASNAVQFRTLSTNTRLVRSTTAAYTAAYTAATLTNIRQLYNATAAASQVTTLDNIVVGDVIILKLRGLDQYAVVQVTGINRTSTTDVTVSFNIKAL